MSKMKAKESPNWKWRIQLRETVLGVSSSAVAKAAGMTPSTYHSLCNASNANTKTLQRVADALGCTLSWLLKDCPRAVIAKEAAEMPPPQWVE